MGNYPKPLKETHDIRMDNGEFPYLDVDPIINIFAPDYSDTYLWLVQNPALVSYDRASKASYLSSTGKLHYTNNKQMRIDYNPLTKEKRGFVIENQATNLIYSNNFGLAMGSSGTGSLTKNTDPVFNVPRGTTLQTSGSTGTCGVQSVSYAGSINPNTKYVVSCVAKMESDTFEWMGFDIGNYVVHTAKGRGTLAINYKTKEVTYESSLSNEDKKIFYIEFWNDGYVYIARSFFTVESFADVAENIRYSGPRVYFRNTGNLADSNSITGDGVSKIHLLMPQLETATTGFSNNKGSSYIALSESAATTRAKDFLSLAISELDGVTSVTGTLLLDVDGVRTCIDGTFTDGYQLSKRGYYRQVALFPRYLTDDEKFKVING